MNGIDFFDSNILIYAYDPVDPRKQAIAQALMIQAMEGRALWSTQVIAEFSRTLLHKLKKPAKPEELQPILASFASVDCIVPDLKLIQRAADAHAVYGLRFWDGMIVAAAERPGCARILSEDFNAGQAYFGVRAENPFSL